MAFPIFHAQWFLLIFAKSAFSGAGMSFLLFLILQTFLSVPPGLSEILA
jgi:hypothetical protein